MERANTRSFEAVREAEQPAHEETVEGDHAESGYRVKRVSSLQHLTTADVKHLKSGKQYLSKMQLVVEEATRLGVAAGVNTKPENTREVLTLYEATKAPIVTGRTEKN
eukprot:12004615-Ditylum_brightwellii.AAC.1